MAANVSLLKREGFTQHVLEQIFIVDFRFIFPFASDLTSYRALLALRYLPFLLAGFVFISIIPSRPASQTAQRNMDQDLYLMVIPISTWFYQITGKIYLGAFLNGLLVTWMFVSSQVIAPIPV